MAAFGCVGDRAPHNRSTSSSNVAGWGWRSNSTASRVRSRVEPIGTGLPSRRTSRHPRTPNLMPAFLDVGYNKSSRCNDPDDAPLLDRHAPCVSLGSSSNSSFLFGTIEVYSLATLFGVDG